MSNDARERTGQGLELRREDGTVLARWDAVDAFEPQRPFVERVIVVFDGEVIGEMDGVEAVLQTLKAPSQAEGTAAPSTPPSNPATCHSWL